MLKEWGVAELQGPYGPIQVSERFLQLIWLRGRYFREGLRTMDGRSLEITHCGKWNHVEGPDFLGGSWRVDGGEVISGDIELHFYAEDWYRHRHHEDPNYNGVGLHVTLFPVDPGMRAALTEEGQVPLGLSLLPYLDEDLESLAEEEALLQMEERWQNDWIAVFSALDRSSRLKRIGEGAGRRWRRKASQCKQLLAEVGWEEALHEKTLEVLGFSRNRQPMQKLAREFSWRLLREKSMSVETLYLSRREEWKTNGLRPVNHPRRRLEQYLDLLQIRPSWPLQAVDWARQLTSAGVSGESCSPEETSTVRRRGKFSTIRRGIQHHLFEDKLGGTRLETWVVEALLPLHAAQARIDCFSHWFHWFPGDFPDTLRSRFPALFGPGETVPVLCNGAYQGLMDLIIEEETGFVQLEFKDLPEGFS